MSNLDQSTPSIQHAQHAVKSQRDPRLDFWRGLAMLFILVAHIPGNSWGAFLPGRWGPSDAAETFVFCSGFAAAIAFGGTFERNGFWMGTRRILFRYWQIYWAHIGLFLFIAMTTVITTWLSGPDGTNYMDKLGITPFFQDTGQNLVGLFTLTYVPNYFDILPMYLGILLLVPVVIALQRIHTGVAIAFCVGLYAATWMFGLNFPAEPWSDRKWFFNPLGWQILFFTGFMLSKGWIKPPPFRTWLLVIAAVYIIVMAPLANWNIYLNYPWLERIHELLWAKGFKTNEHPLRWLHVMAITYLVVWVIHGREQVLLRWPLSIVVKVGQQALPAFMTSMALAWNLGFVLDEVGRTPLTEAVVNLFGLTVVIAVVYMVSWYKSQPWRRAARAEADRTGQAKVEQSPGRTATAATAAE